MDTNAHSGFFLTHQGIFYWFLDPEKVRKTIGPVSYARQVAQGQFALHTGHGGTYRVLLAPAQCSHFKQLGGVLKEVSEASATNQPPPRWGFQKMEAGLFFWWGPQGKVNRIGPVLRLERVGGDKFRLVTAESTHPVQLTREGVAEFQCLGGKLLEENTTTSVAGRNAGPRCGFQANGKDLFFCFRDQNGGKAQVGPVAWIESLENGLYRIRTTIAQAHRVRLTPSEVMEFAALGGTVREKTDFPGMVPLALTWKGTGQKITIGQYTITDPNTYFSLGRPNVEEACCIDLTLAVGQPAAEPPGALGFWPRYSGMSSTQRANYLSWLASGRNEPLNDIGYAFLYFYGLERRILLDNQDLNAVVAEVVRLSHQYTFSGSFKGYVSRFLAFVLARTGLEKLSEEWFSFIFEKNDGQLDEDLLAVGLAWLVKRNGPMSASWAMRLAKQHPHTPRSVVVDRLPEKFQALFTRKYCDRFGEGLMLKTAKKDREVEYAEPASPTLLALRQQKHAFSDSVMIPNVVGLQSQFTPLVKIWTDCIAALKNVGDKIARGADSREVWRALPPELRQETDHPDKQRWEEIMAMHTTEGPWPLWPSRHLPRWDEVVAMHTTEDGVVLVPISALAEIQEIKQRAKLTPRQSADICETADWLKLGLEPDVRITGRPYAWHDIVCLFRPEGDSRPPPDKRYASAALTLELAMAVAAADDVIKPEETAHIMHFLEDQFRLDPEEARRLEALKQVFLVEHPSLAGVGKRLRASLGLPQREVLGQFLFGIAATTGSLNKPTIAALKSAYRVLDIQLDGLDRLLASVQLSVQAPALGAEVSENKAGQYPQTIQEQEPAPLSDEYIRQIMNDTRDVGRILVDAINAAERTTPSAGPSLVPSNRPATLAALPNPTGLDGALRQVMEELLERDEWSHEEFTELVRKHQLMPAAAVEKINKWSEENYNDLLIDEGDSFVIQRHLINVNT